jgi:hypothetical protein
VLQQCVTYVVGAALMLAVAGTLTAGGRTVAASARTPPTPTCASGPWRRCRSVRSPVSSRAPSSRAGHRLRGALAPVVLLTGSGLSMPKASSSVVLPACLGVAALGAMATARSRHSRPTAADAVDEPRCGHAAV